MNILYEDNALVVLDKPAGLSSEEGVPAALRQHWDTPDAFVGVVHRLDTGKRLEYVYHGKAKMTITSEQEKGTLVVLEIPLKKAKEIMENGTSGNDIG